MKPFALIIFISICFHSEAQLFQFWNTNVLYNQSLQALDYEHSAYGATDFRGLEDPETNFNFTSANYASYFKKINSGVGLNFLNSRTKFGGRSVVKLTYNYQFKLKQNTTLSLGGAFGSMSSKYVYSNTFPTNDTTLRDQSLLGDLGITLKIDRFKIAYGIQNLGDLNPLADRWIVSRVNTLYLDYIFDKKEGFQFRPSVMGVKNEVFNGLFLQGQFGFNQSAFFGIGASFFDVFIDNAINVNVEFILFENVKLSYTANLLKSKSNFSLAPQTYRNLYHEFGLGVQFGNRNTKKPEQL